MMQTAHPDELSASISAMDARELFNLLDHSGDAALSSTRRA
jgi:hypothetical protein